MDGMMVLVGSFLGNGEFISLFHLQVKLSHQFGGWSSWKMCNYGNWLSPICCFKRQTISGWGDQANHRPIRGFSTQVLCWISQPCWQQWIKQLILMVEMHLPQIPWVALRGMPMVILLLPQLSVSIFFLLQIGMLGVVQFVAKLWIPDPSVGRVGVWFWIVYPSNTRFIHRFILL